MKPLSVQPSRPVSAPDSKTRGAAGDDLDGVDEEAALGVRRVGGVAEAQLTVLPAQALRSNVAGTHLSSVVPVMPLSSSPVMLPLTVVQPEPSLTST